VIAQIADHLWQSTLFALGAGLLTLPLRRNSAGVRYGLWFAASVKFLVPFALLSAAGGALASRFHISLLPPQAAAAAQPAGGPLARSALDWAPQMMAPATTFQAPAAVPASHALVVPFDPAPLLVVAWALGVVVLVLVWTMRWSRIRAALKAASPIDLPIPLPAMSSPAQVEPGVVGVLRPVLVLPHGIADRLSPAELDAIIAHELCHVRRRDNLTGAVHMLVQALFWFHPLVWWLGDRLIAERERASDEGVVRAGHDRETYARGVIETCRLYLQAPLTCVAGAAGSNLEMRVEEIISRPLSAPLPLEVKAWFGMTGALVLAIPVAAGLLTARPERLAELVQAAQTVVQSAVRTAVLPATSARLSALPAATAIPRALAPAAQVSAAPARPIVLAQAPPQSVVIPPIAATPNLQATPAAPALALAPATAATPSLVPQETASPAGIRRQAFSFAQAFGATTATLDQLARWTQPVCVTVQGLPAEAAAKVVGRVEEVAGAIGVGTLPAGCKPNVQIMFSGNPQALLDRVAAEHERMLGYWHHRDRDRLKAVTHPIQAWYVTGTGGDGGNVVGLTFATGNTAAVGATGGQPHGFQIDDEDNAWWGPTGCGDKSKFTACLTSEFQSVLVVVDTGKAQDAGLGQIADYVAMLAMAQPRSLDGCNSLPSVIELFCGGRLGGVGLTRADVAYLTALYKTDLQARKAVQQRDIADRMADLLIRADARDRLAALDATARR
jgi:beta-lactamase regulating signal transducer with metallopeptidase domain